MVKVGTKNGTGDLYLIMSNVNALVDMLLPPDEFGDIAMTPEILNQIRNGARSPIAWASTG